VTGVHIGSGLHMGASIGVNKWGLSACSSTVLANSSTAYDTLLERLLMECRSFDEACELVQADLDNGNRYQWCNFIIAAPNLVGAIEIGDGVMAYEVGSDMITRANHHLKLPTNEALKSASRETREAGGPLQDSQRRRQAAARMLKSSVSLGDMITIVTDHSVTRGFDSICRHRNSLPDEPYLGETSYSYILEVLQLNSDDFDIRMHITRGNPCLNTFSDFMLDFALPLDRKREVAESIP
ncbi:MAG: hypothetical protein ACFFD6_05610, partial [Candidatus Thorarchaeota archaeon]